MGRRPSFAAIAVLRALTGDGTYGLDIIAATGLPSGTVYPLLARFERDGLVRARWERAVTATAEGRPRRRYYALTTRGHATLREGLEMWSALADLPAGLPGMGRA